MLTGLYTVAASLTMFAPFLASMNADRLTPTHDTSISQLSAKQCSAGKVHSGILKREETSSAKRIDETVPSHSEPQNVQLPSQLSATRWLDALHNGRTANQHRIERRVTIRITPLRPSNRNNLLAQLPRRGITNTFEERKMDNCLPVSGIAGVQTSTGNRLLLFLRDKRIVSLNLERGCEARDFYSGFYIERSEDGRLCVNRDKLQSRSGAKCEVERMRRLVKTGG